MEETKKPYEPPAIIYRAPLEACATACRILPYDVGNPDDCLPLRSN
jgi:hypothetical protein